MCGKELNPILNVFVVGFHHKKGPQIEYSFPEIGELPDEWKYLPVLAIPDGSHNYFEDTVYFHLRDPDGSGRTVFGVSCCCQIETQRVQNPTDDLTRSTVFRGVVVISKIPLYGHMQVHVSQVARYYMDTGQLNDFTQMPLLYQNLNSNLAQHMQSEIQIYTGLSLQDLMYRFRHKVLLLWKLVLLERRVLFTNGSAHAISSTILTLLSLFPKSLAEGMTSATNLRSDGCEGPSCHCECCETQEAERFPVDFTESANLLPLKSDSAQIVEELFSGEQSDRTKKVLSPECGQDEKMNNEVQTPQQSPTRTDASSFTGDFRAVFPLNFDLLDNLEWNCCGLPLNLFSEGYVCHPFLSLHLIDLLLNPGVRAYLFGATNILFEQKQNCYDVLVSIEDQRIDIKNPNLRRALQLTTQDLRFADFMLQVCHNLSDLAIRNCFWLYGCHLLATSHSPVDIKDSEPYGSCFLAQWYRTHNFKYWKSNPNSGILQVPIGHPFLGQLSIHDMKIRLSHTFQSTERGRKLNETIRQTSRAVGGAFSNAKGALSSWWTQVTRERSKLEDDEEDNENASPDSDDAEEMA